VSVWSWSGLLNRHTGEWDAEWLRHLGIRAEQLPPLAAPGEWLTGLLPAYAARWPFLKDVRCLPALGDGAAANVGSGCVDATRIAVTIGSTAALRIVAPTTSLDVAPAGLWAYNVDHQRALMGGATTEGGNVFTWLRRTLQLPPADELEAQISRMPPDAHGLTVLPLFAGERSPGFSENSRATLHGLTLDTEPAQIARACLEAIAYRLGLVYDELRALAQPGATLVASGGALLASPTWRQIIADVTGAALTVCEEPEATSRGVALLVLEQLTGQADLGSARLGDTWQPDPQRHAIYRAAMARQQALYAQVVAHT
jgi:gluconokinase